MEFPDGRVPNGNIIKRFMNLVEETFKSQKGEKLTQETDESDPKCIAIHCIAGLGRYAIVYIYIYIYRAPVIVAIALIENNTPNIKAIQHIRSIRKSSFNNSQTDFLLRYKPTHNPAHTCCTIF